MKPHDYVSIPPAIIHHNGKRLVLRQPTHAEIEETKELRRESAARRRQIERERGSVSVIA